MKKSKIGLSVKSVLFTTLFSYALVIAFAFILALIFNGIEKYERLYYLSKYILIAISGISIAVFSRITTDDIISNSAISGALTALLTFGISLCLKGNSIDLISALISLALILILPVAFSLIMIFIASNNNKKRKFKFK